MIESTRGIVLNYTRYAESSIISHIYTQKLGLQSYMINQVRSRKKKDKHVFLQALSLLDLEVYHSEKKTIHRIKDFKVNTPFTQIPFEPVRRSLAFFLAEVLNKALKQEDKRDANLFTFLHQSISMLDSHLPGVQNFHLFLLFRLTRPLGFFPSMDSNEALPYFNLKTGTFQQSEPAHPHYMNHSETSILRQLSEIRIEELDSLQISQDDRTKFIEKMLEYYQLHLSGFSNIKSLKVLKELYR
ncbi:DNA repair protein RecO [Saccharicrinis fermentans]|uniref:DNA repair protein RecO n=1 Tax=Saccharicrinis fermentans DSM 9555 = JCM 21142 TaxID=869213 RepID=W7XY58_9BACT|nr:DNA repair protein RecO [Saccharicrinis fermentans]GAF03545.1 DNA repair protein RecO [Saccharicrinis fermentans DSM 9555 = JCM 21142]